MTTEDAPAVANSQEELFFIINIDYISDLQRIDRLLPDHRKWLEEGFSTENFLVSGLKQSRSGEMILARAGTRNEIENLAATDPFILARAAVNIVTVVRPTMSETPLNLVKMER